MKKKTTIAIVIAALFAIVISTPSKDTLEEQIKETTSTKIVTTLKSTTTKKITTTTSTTTTTTTTTTTKKVGSGKAEKVDVSTIPEYSGKPYVVINDNVPNFSSEELSTKGYEKYSDLDSLGRTRTAIASVGEDTMPKDGEERGSISAIKPSGWIQATYDNISGKYLYNRAHLIGWQLSAENANKKNLITGTKYLNVTGMLPFENMVADYIKETKNHVAYRITPIYDGNNLVASGVQMEAYSVEDDGEGISFNVYCYNVQPDIIINYKDGSSKLASSKTTKKTTTKKTTTKKTTTKKASSENSEIVYITASGSKYHSKESCRGLNNAKKIYEATLSEAKNKGLEACKICY
jgi:DNA-entry nuclease